MILTNKVAAKFAVAIVAAAMMFAAFVPATNAQNIEDMSLEQLLALVAQLQAQTGTTTVASDACPYTWTRTLNMGATGADVMQLQKFLNSMPETQVAPVGQAGSAGMETSYYGPATGAAVANFQMKYRAEILSPLGLVNATTFFGSSTMAQANKLCVTGTTPTTPGNNNGGSADLSGEASLDTFEVEDGNDSDIEEGDENMEVAEFTVEFSDGDAEISRLDIAVIDASATTTGAGIDPWDVFEEFTLWVDGDEIASVKADDEDEYLDEDERTLRFSDINFVAEEDEEIEIVLGATLQGGIDSDDLPSDWNVYVVGLRFFDAEDVATTVTDQDDIDNGMTAGQFDGANAQFTVEEAGYEEELTFRESSDNPDATTIIVDKDTARTDDVTVLVYEIEAEGGDIDLETLFITIETLGEDVANVVDDIEIKVDGQTFRDEDMDAGTSTVVYEFDIDKDITIDEDEMVEVEVMVTLNGNDGGTNYINGQTLTAKVTSTNADATVAEGDDDLTGADITGTANGETHTLVAEGIVVPADSFEADISTIDEGRVGVFDITVDVTAVEDTFYLDTATVASWITVEGGAASTTVVVDTSADDDTAGVYEIAEGTTESFTFTVTVDPAAAGSFRVTLDEVEYSTDETGVAAATTYTLTPASDYRTGYQALTN